MLVKEREHRIMVSEADIKPLMNKLRRTGEDKFAL